MSITTHLSAKAALWSTLLACSVAAQSPLPNVTLTTPSTGLVWLKTFNSSVPAELEGSITNSGQFHGRWEQALLSPPTNLTVSGVTWTSWIGTVPSRAGQFEILRSVQPLAVPNFGPTWVEEWFVKPKFTDGTAINRFKWTYAIDSSDFNDIDEVTSLFPMTNGFYVRDALNNMTQAAGIAFKTLFPAVQFDYGLTDYRRLPGTSSGHYANRLNPADVLTIHAFENDQPRWGLSVHELDAGNANPANLLLGSNGGVMEFGSDVFIENDDLANNGLPDSQFYSVGVYALHVLPATRGADDAWWECVDIMRDFFMPILGLNQNTQLANTTKPPAAIRRGFLATGYFAENPTSTAATIESFVTQLDPQTTATVEYLPAITSWYKETLAANWTPFPDFIGLMNALNASPRAAQIRPLAYMNPGAVSYAPVVFPITSLPSGAQTAWDQIFLWNDRKNPYSEQCSIDECFVPIDPTDPAWQAEMVRAATVELQARGVEGVYYDAVFGDLRSDYRFRGGRSRDHHTGMVSSIDMTRQAWPEMLALGEQARLGNPLVPGGAEEAAFGALPGASGVPFFDALLHSRVLTQGAGDFLVQWFPHALQVVEDFRTDFQMSGVTPQKEDLEDLLYIYVNGFTQGRLPLDADSGLGVQTFEVSVTNPVIAPTLSTGQPLLNATQTAAVQVLQDCATIIYPLMIDWRASCLALQQGEMLPPPQPVNLNNWKQRRKLRFYGGDPALGSTGADLCPLTYDGHRFPVSFWSDPANADELTLFMGNHEYDPVVPPGTPSSPVLQFMFNASDYPQMAGSNWDVNLVTTPGGAPTLLQTGVSQFNFSVTLPELSFAKVVFTRVP